MQITFSPAESWSFDRASIVFHARAEGKTIRCIVSQEFLTDPSVREITEEEARKIFHDRRGEIESLIQERIQAGEFDALDEIILRTPSP